MPWKNKRSTTRKKATIWIITIAVAAALVIGIGVGIYAGFYNNRDHMADMTDRELYEFNYVLTAFGRNAELTADNEVLILESMTKNLGGDTEVTFKIYRYERESDLSAGLEMTNQQISENSSYTYMGHGTVILVDDSFAGMSNMKVMYVR